MTPRRSVIAVCFVSCAFVGCGGNDRPSGLNSADSGVAIPPADNGPSLDLGAFDAGTPQDAPATDAVTRDAAPVEASVDAPASDAASDASVDAGRRVRSFCGFSQAEVSNLAVRAATCFHMAPQRMLEQVYRPSWWESGVLPQRDCGTLRAALATTNGCTGFLLDVLKIIVRRTADGTCPGPVVGCEAAGISPTGAAVTCVNGYTLSQECEAVTGVNQCLTDATHAACRPQSGDTAPCTGGSRCVNGILQACVSGAYVRAADCDPGLTVCDATAGACVGTGPVCAGTADACDGSQLRQCRGGRSHAVDCGFLVGGATCHGVGVHAFCGVAADCDPVAAPDSGTCDGTTLVLCGGGQSLRFDCTRAGFTGCAAGSCIP